MGAKVKSLKFSGIGFRITSSTNSIRYLQIIIPIGNERHPNNYYHYTEEEYLMLHNVLFNRQEFTHFADLISNNKFGMRSIIGTPSKIFICFVTESGDLKHFSFDRKLVPQILTFLST